MDNNFSDILGIFKKLNEGTMASAEQKPTGPSFAGGKWKGTDSAADAKNKYVGASEGVEECEKPMSLMDALKARWEKTKNETGLQEYGMTTGGTAMAGATGQQNNTVDAAQTAKELNQTQQSLNKLKGAGVNLPTGVSQAAKSAVGTVNDPTKVPNQQDKNISMSLGNEIEQLITKGDPSQVNQLTAALKQAKMGQQ